MDFNAYFDQINHGFTRKEKNGVIYFTVPAIDTLGFYGHGFFARVGGVSEGCFSSLNFSFKRETNSENIIQNFKIACATIGTEFENLTIINYCHGNGVHLAQKSDCGQGMYGVNTLPLCDGLLVNAPGVTAVALHADCTPVFFADKKGRAAGVCHAGWKGVYANIASAMIEKLETLGILKEDIIVGVGPCINRCCFEVKDDVSGKFLAEYGEDVVEHRDGNQYLDMPRIILHQLCSLEIPAKNVTVSDLCTYCSPELFFSFRRDRGKTGAMASMIFLK